MGDVAVQHVHTPCVRATSAASFPFLTKVSSMRVVPMWKAMSRGRVVGVGVSQAQNVQKRTKSTFTWLGLVILAAHFPKCQQTVVNSPIIFSPRASIARLMPNACVKK